MVDYELDGKVAIVTGAAGGGAGGTGLRIAQLLAENGARVAMADISPAGQASSDALNARGCDTMFVQMDLSKEETVTALVQQTIERFGALDILVNCAFRQMKEGQLAETSVDAWDTVVHVNLRGTFLMIHHALPHLVERGGSIVNISSIASIVGEDSTAAYAACKAGINALTRSTAVQYGDKGVRCNAIAPGSILNDRILEYAKTNESVQFEFDMLKRHTPLKRYGAADDIANLALFLAGDKSSNITGQTIACDGGYSIRSGTWADIHEFKQTHEWGNL